MPTNVRRKYNRCHSRLQLRHYLTDSENENAFKDTYIMFLCNRTNAIKNTIFNEFLVCRHWETIEIASIVEFIQ